MLLTLIRHGAVEGRAHVFRGRSDPPLSSAGWEQLACALAVFDESPPDCLVSSPSRRCLEFASHWTQARQIPLRILDALREIDFGEWEERSPEEARWHDPAAYASFVSDPEQWCSPGGESYREFRTRVLRAIEELRTGDLQHAAILAHAGVIRVLLCESLDIRAPQALRIALAYGSTCRIWYDGTRSQLLTLQQPAA
jgi:broad specificity phosphatase PhoE